MHQDLIRVQQRMIKQRKMQLNHPKKPKPPRRRVVQLVQPHNKKKVAELHKMEMEARAREDEVEKAEMKGYLFSKWDKYKRRFPEYAPAGAEKVTANSSYDTINSALQSLKDNLTADSSHQGAKMLIGNLAAAFEFITMDQGINPSGINFRGLGAVVKQDLAQKESYFEPEVSECSIELGSWLAGPWYFRLLNKLGQSAAHVNSINGQKLTEIGQMSASDFTKKMS